MVKMGLGLLSVDLLGASRSPAIKRKALPDGNTRYKARLVIRGFLQRHGVDFMETYAPTASLTVFRLLVAISVFNG